MSEDEKMAENDVKDREDNLRSAEESGSGDSGSAGNGESTGSGGPVAASEAEKAAIAEQAFLAGVSAGKQNQRPVAQAYDPRTDGASTAYNAAAGTTLVLGGTAGTAYYFKRVYDTFSGENGFWVKPATEEAPETLGAGAQAARDVQAQFADAKAEAAGKLDSIQQGLAQMRGVEATNISEQDLETARELRSLTESLADKYGIDLASVEGSTKEVIRDGMIEAQNEAIRQASKPFDAMVDIPTDGSLASEEALKSLANETGLDAGEMTREWRESSNAEMIERLRDHAATLESEEAAQLKAQLDRIEADISLLPENVIKGAENLLNAASRGWNNFVEGIGGRAERLSIGEVNIDAPTGLEPLDRNNDQSALRDLMDQNDLPRDDIPSLDQYLRDGIAVRAEEIQSAAVEGINADIKEFVELSANQSEGAEGVLKLIDQAESLGIDIGEIQRNAIDSNNFRDAEGVLDADAYTAAVKEAGEGADFITALKAATEAKLTEALEPAKEAVKAVELAENSALEKVFEPLSEAIGTPMATAFSKVASAFPGIELANVFSGPGVAVMSGLSFLAYGLAALKVFKAGQVLTNSHASGNAKMNAGLGAAMLVAAFAIPALLPFLGVEMAGGLIGLAIVGAKIGTLLLGGHLIKSADKELKQQRQMGMAGAQMGHGHPQVAVGPRPAPAM